MAVDKFASRHIGPDDQESAAMLKEIGVASVDELIDKTIPRSIRLKDELNLPEALTEQECLSKLRTIAGKNKLYRSYIGLGYYNTFTPPVIQRGILENPGWYTSYTPYQAEISQGRLEGLLNFQTMVTELTGMELANASLLDEATAAAEAMAMLFSLRSRKEVKAGVNKFFVSENCFPQTIAVLKTKADSLNIELVIGDHNEVELDASWFGAIVQYPDGNGEVNDFQSFVGNARENGIKVAVIADILSLTLLTPPGEWGADVVVGATQRFGVQMGYGGPYAAYFATRKEFKRNIPGRIIGVSVDRKGKRALRMALQTREQHIKRDRATSNICTAQALLAIMAGMYAVYHGSKGVKKIAEKVHRLTVSLSEALEKLGYEQLNEVYFDTLKVKLPENVTRDGIRKIALKNQVNFRYFDDDTVGISIDETVTEKEVEEVLEIFAKAIGNDDEYSFSEPQSHQIPENFQRKSVFLTQPVFNKYHSETEMMRYLKKLENKDISLTHSMISLGSCTMKLNAVSELLSLSIPQFSGLHPFVPADQAEGYKEIIDELAKWLCEITGFEAVTFQPNSGAQGEYTGLLVIREYLKDIGEGQRNIVLIPSSAHGTNPASAVMAGMKVVVVKCDEYGNIATDDLKAQAEKHSDHLAAVMITYPSTHGVFEDNIVEITEIIHQHGGQVYMDGANMNAQVGLTNPGIIGADVCHLNLHKTFAIPHGGGGPGMGPIGVAKHLRPYLPRHPLAPTGGEKGIHAVAMAPWGSASILLISYAYLKMLGKGGLKTSSEMAILNANYMKAKLEKHFPVLYKGVNGFVAHEMIIDCRNFKRTAKTEVEDIAKRLIDYGFHAPTVSFPVNGTLMIEPTESESKEEIDRFCEAMTLIRNEIAEVESGAMDIENNVLKNAPHTAEEVIRGEWRRPYSRDKAVYPTSWLIESKYWVPVSRVDNAYGDRNLICTCPSVESYEEEAVV